MWDTMTNQFGAQTEQYSMGVRKCIAIADAVSEAETGDPIVIIVDVQGGASNSFQSVIYDKEQDAAAVFECSGTTIDYYCDIVGSDS
mmetsp:Transcript_90090/g.200189  ORF Transcript_90090/g.200189 Transcript_90090/m.200189 type:complete len:87 (+) Transcript_90090:1-261(+)